MNRPVRRAASIVFCMLLSACSDSELPSFEQPDFDASVERCGSMTPLLEILPQENIVAGAAEQMRSCTYSHVSARYVDARRGAQFKFFVSVTDGMSPFVYTFTRRRPMEKSSAERVMARSGERELVQYDLCLRDSEPLEQSGRQTIAVTTEVEGQQVCISAFTSSGTLIGDLYLRPRPDLLVQIRYTKSPREGWPDIREAAEVLLPLVEAITLPTEGWPAPDPASAKELVVNE